MSMTDDTRGDGESLVQETSSSSREGAGSVAPVMSYRKDWGQGGPLDVTYDLTLTTTAAGAVVYLIGTNQQSQNLGPIPSGGSGTTFKGTYHFGEKKYAELKFEVKDKMDFTPRPFDVVRAAFTP